MLPPAQRKVAELDAAAADYTAVDMSWTKPAPLVPCLCDHATNLGVKRIRQLINLERSGNVRGAYEYQRLRFPAPTAVSMGYVAASAQQATKTVSTPEAVASGQVCALVGSERCVLKHV